MRVGEVCNREVVFATGEMTADAVARLMREHHVGDVVVVEERAGQRVPVGIVTDRDLVVELLAAGVEPSAVTAADFMSPDLVSVPEAQDIWSALEQMRSAGVRRLPIVSATGHLVGILTLDDVLEFLAEEVTAMVRAIGREQAREQRLRS